MDQKTVAKNRGHEPKSALECFEWWLCYRSQDSALQLTPQAAEPYRYIWRSWCTWLLGQGEENPLSWKERVWHAQTEQALAFLAEKVKPATQRAGSDPGISTVTRERYCMVLREVYAHLTRLGILDNNPMLRLYEMAGPARPDGEVLNPEFWSYLQQLYRVLPKNDSPFLVRDRALLGLLLDIALTPAELSALSLEQLVLDGAGWPVSLRVNGSRPAQKRELALGAVSQSALHDWLQIRELTLAGANTVPEPVVADLVFFSERRRALSRRVLFHLTSQWITEASQAWGSAPPRHVGPLVLRNTVILGWCLAGVPVAEVCRRAGYQNALALAHLRPHWLANTTRENEDF